MAEASTLTALVTGASDGVGKVVAKRLAENGIHVLVHGRDQAKTDRAAAAITAATGGSAETVIADFASLRAVRDLSDHLLQRQIPLNILINNAGIGIADGRREESADGHELRFAVNYLSHFLLTHRLLDRIRASAPARIVNVSSAGQAPIDFDDVMLERDYSGRHAYCQSKLAQIMFTIDLAEVLHGAGVVVNALHPASYMNTKMVPSPISSVEDGADAIMNLAVGDATADVSGKYFNQMREAPANSQAYDASARQTLRRLSEDLTGLDA